jgi:hypothetical protein
MINAFLMRPGVLLSWWEKLKMAVAVFQHKQYLSCVRGDEAMHHCVKALFV